MRRTVATLVVTAGLAIVVSGAAPAADIGANDDTGKWSATLFVNNLLDEYYETGVVSTPLFNQVLTDDDGGDVNTRSYYTYVGAPRLIGVRFNYKIG